MLVSVVEKIEISGKSGARQGCKEKDWSRTCLHS